MSTAAKQGLALFLIALALYAGAAYLVADHLLDPPSPFSWPKAAVGAVAAVALSRVRGQWRFLGALVGGILALHLLTDAPTFDQVVYGIAAACAVMLAYVGLSGLRALADAYAAEREVAELPEPAVIDPWVVAEAAPEPILVGLTGYAESGKDTAAKGLLWTGEWAHASFAAKLKDFLYAVNPLISVHRGMPGYDAFNVADTPVLYVRYAEYVDEVGLEVAKQNDEVRKLLQRTGTDAGRQVLGDNVWVDAAMDDLPLGNVVFTDVRFPNEAAAIQDAGGYVIRVVRPGHGAVNGHGSETALDDYPVDATIVNDGTMQDLHARLKTRIGMLEFAHARTA